MNPHYDHDVIIWENSDYIVNLGKKTADVGSNGGFDEHTPLQCIDCGTEIEDDEEFREQIQEVVTNL